jgi:anti-sigma regulatory factor (Ser/Thr protein kinase)
VLENDAKCIAPLVDHLQFTALNVGLVDHSERIRLAKALVEALRNAMYHGNLELSAEETCNMRISPASQESILSRRYAPPYCHRRVYVDSTISPEEARFVIRDEGPGFDPTHVPRVTEDPTTMIKCERRGLILITTFMDEVTFNDLGNEITLVKRKKSIQFSEPYSEMVLTR